MTFKTIHDALSELRYQNYVGVTTVGMCHRCNSFQARGSGVCKPCIEDELRLHWRVPDDAIKALFDAHEKVRAALIELEEARERVVVTAGGA